MKWGKGLEQQKHFGEHKHMKIQVGKTDTGKGRIKTNMQLNKEKEPRS